MGIDQAIEALKSNYEYACSKDYIVNPVGYALYYTWKDQSAEFSRLYEKEAGVSLNDPDHH